MSNPPTATMRVNVYAEAIRIVDDEYGTRVFLVEKQVKDLPFKHHAIRILIGERIMHTDFGKSKRDDDTAAVTFWYSDEQQRQMLVQTFERALNELSKPEAKY